MQLIKPVRNLLAVLAVACLLTSCERSEGAAGAASHDPVDGLNPSVDSSSASASAQDSSRLIREHVQRFYDWYVPSDPDDYSGPAWDVLMNDSSSVFSPELLSALRADSEAQAQAVGEMVGLDFDPFVNAQDHCERYEAGQVTGGENRYRVEVFAVCSGQRGSEPVLSVELVPGNEAWAFTNVHYPGSNSDLQTILRELSEGRDP